MPIIQVALGERSYPILIENGILDRAGACIREKLGDRRIAVVTDDNVAPLYLQRLMDSLAAAGLPASSLVLPHGERTKCIASLQQVYTFLAASGVTRKDAVLALGGGVIGDLTGLSAATFLRGVSFVQIPTTLLAQVDSSVGGKVAVDLPEGKNLVGAFWQPSLVLCDPDTLNTLTPEYWRDGMGEVVKYGCIGDAELFALLEKAAAGGRTGMMQHIDEILYKCIRMKADVVEKDEKDLGLRMILNFGHTIGHAVETCQHYDGLRHGEAVSVGMVAMTKLTEKKGMTEPGTLARLTALLTALDMPQALPAIPEEQLLQAMGHDKKNMGKVLHVLVVPAIGQCTIVDTDATFFRGMTAM